MFPKNFLSFIQNSLYQRDFKLLPKYCRLNAVSVQKIARDKKITGGNATEEWFIILNVLKPIIRPLKPASLFAFIFLILMAKRHQVLVCLIRTLVSEL